MIILVYTIVQNIFRTMLTVSMRGNLSFCYKSLKKKEKLEYIQHAHIGACFTIRYT